MGFNWPSTIGEKPLLQKIEGKTCHYKDGSTEDVDTIIMCTGYLHSYPFLEDNLRLRSHNSLYPKNLYRGMVWLGTNGDGNNCGNSQLLYIGRLNITINIRKSGIDLTDPIRWFITAY